MDWNVILNLIRNKSKRSPSSRGRGLKFLATHLSLQCLSRPLHEGVDWNWNAQTDSLIPTSRPLHEGVDWNDHRRTGYRFLDVALFTRAWIEIFRPTAWQPMIISRPLHEGVDWNRPEGREPKPSVRRPLHEGVDWNRYCGLYLRQGSRRPLHEGVDWNNIIQHKVFETYGRPLHEGVDWNLSINGVSSFIEKSPSSRGRGLKLKKDYNLVGVNNVALFTRAWIEIYFLGWILNVVSVALFTRAWIEILSVKCTALGKLRRPLHEGVDWNIACYGILRYSHSRPLHEGVDWNVDFFGDISCGQNVALFTRAWIEIDLR